MHARELKANRLYLYYLMMGVLVFAGDWAKAIPDQLAEAASYLDQKQYQQAYAVYDHIFVNFPEDDNAFTAGKGRVEASIGMDDYSGAQQAFDELRYRFPVHPELSQVLLGIGHAHIRSHNHIQAVSTFQRMIDDYPSANANVLAQATYQLGRSYRNIGNHDQAIVTLEHGLADYADVNEKVTVDALYLLGITYYDTGNYSPAIAAFDRILKNHSSTGAEMSTRTMYQLGRSYHNVGDFGQAIAMFEQVAAAHTNINDTAAVDALLRLGRLYYDTGKYARASDAVEQILTGYADVNKKATVNALLQLGRIRYDTGDHTQAIAAFEQILTSYADVDEKVTIDALFQSGIIHRATGDYGRAITKFDRILKDYGSGDSDLSAQAWYHLGRSYYEAGKKEQAIAAYEWMLEKKPDQSVIADQPYLRAYQDLLDLYLSSDEPETVSGKIASLLAESTENHRLPTAMIGFALSYLENNIYNEAFDLYKDALTRSTVPYDIILAYGGLARCYVRLGDDAKVLEIVNIILEEYGDIEGASHMLLLIGEEYYFKAQEISGTEDIDTIRALYRRAIDVLEETFKTAESARYFGLSHYVIGLASMQTGDYLKAAEAFTSSYHVYPEYQRADYCMFAAANCYERLAQDDVISWAEAEAEIRDRFTLLLERHPESRYAANAKGFLGLN